ncbi:MAG: steryl acetyl hydrolase [Bacteroidetes bacterium]|nr:MAG: steryl acetyl hydrolase [Bacteroidota bacterium]
MPPSLPARLTASLLKIVGFKKMVEKQVKKPISRSKKPFAPTKIARKYVCAVQEIRGKDIATFSQSEQEGLPHLFFLHGGAYVFEASGLHWGLAEKLVQALGCRLTLVDYPLAPEHTYRDTFAMVEAAYAYVRETYPADRFGFLGDSAGAGLALALAQKLARSGQGPLPEQLILLSPWLDITMRNPEARAQEATDHILTLEMLRHTGHLYSGGDDPQQYLLSPLQGELGGLPPTQVFYSTEEVFYADCRELARRAEAAGADFTFHEYAGMPHDWAVLPIPERQRTVADIKAFVQARL